MTLLHKSSNYFSDSNSKVLGWEINTFAIYFCLFLSGATSLTYELIWTRKLTLIFGNTLYAISAVLCAFMIGLALGAWITPKILNRFDPNEQLNLIKVYAIAEVLIGLYALLFPYLLDSLQNWFYSWGEIEITAIQQVSEFSICALIMLPATFLMGATLPIIGTWASQKNKDKILHAVSRIYGLNTFGAMFGCLFAQFIGIKYFGVSVTTTIAIIINFLIFIACFYIFPSEGLEKSSSTTKKNKNRAKSSKKQSKTFEIFVALLFAYSGMASLGSEILWTRALIFPMGSALHSFAIILATFLFSIALGSLIADKLLRNKNYALIFILIEIAIGLVCIGMLPIFDNFMDWTQQADKIFYSLNSTPSMNLFTHSIFAFGILIVPTVGFGLLFPLANQINLNLFQTIKKTLGGSYTINTLGGVLGTIITPFILIPFFGIRLSIFLIYAGLIIIGFICLSLYRRLKPVPFLINMSVCLALLFSVYQLVDPLISTDQLGKRNFARIEINQPKDQIKLLDYEEGNFSTISAIEDKRNGARSLYIDGFSAATAASPKGGSGYMQAMGFLPMALHPNPQKALVIGFGTGTTLGALGQFPNIDIDMVELDRNVLNFAHWFKRWNHEVYKKPNVNLIFQDGRRFIQSTKKSYDIITLEPMSPVQSGVTNLYSKEFYEFAANHLNENGLAVQWLPLHLVGPEDAKSIVKTFQNAFPFSSVWNSFHTRIILLVGGAKQAVIDKKRIESIIQIPELKNTAMAIGLNSFVDFLDFFITDASPLKTYLMEAPIITDDNPLLEFSSTALLPPFKWQTDESFLNLFRHRVSQIPPLKNFTKLETRYLLSEYELRTAKRSAEFSQTYNLSGKQSFVEKDYLKGLIDFKNYLTKLNKKPISLKE
jgi:spermidine synthase